MDLISPVSIVARQSFGLRLRPRPLTWISKERCRSWAPWPRPQRVVAGPRYGAIGTIWRGKPGKRRLVVGVELLGRSVAVDLGEEGVEPFS